MLILVGDVGKTSVRVALMDGATVLAESRRESPVVLRSDADAVKVARALVAAAREVNDSAARPESSAAAWCIALAGAGATPGLARALARELMVGTLPSRVIVASDIVAAHLSGLRGEYGTVLIAGTGATALSIAPDRDPIQRDGHGPLLGDVGSATWIGQQAVRAAIEAREDRAAATSLENRLLSGATPSDLVRAVNREDNSAAWLAALAPVVLEEWRSGDSVSTRIIGEAIEGLTATVVSADPRPQRVAVTGGLVRSAEFVSALCAVVRDRLKVTEVAVSVDILDGVRRLIDIDAEPVGRRLSGLAATFSRAEFSA